MTLELVCKCPRREVLAAKSWEEGREMEVNAEASAASVIIAEASASAQLNGERELILLPGETSGQSGRPWEFEVEVQWRDCWGSSKRSFS